MVVAMGKQRLATLSPVTEAIVNFVLSIFLARHMGALGVALGTLIASFVGVGCHVLVSMRLTQPAISVNRVHFTSQGWLRPLLTFLPFLLLFPLWDRFSLLPLPPVALLLWIAITAALAWMTGLNSQERSELRATLARLL